MSVRRSPRTHGLASAETVTSMPSSSPSIGAQSGQSSQQVSQPTTPVTSASQHRPAIADNTAQPFASISQQATTIAQPTASSSQQAITTTQSRTTTTQSSTDLELQRQLATLKRQLTETQVRLNESNRQCQYLETTLRSHNLNAVSNTAITTTPVATTSENRYANVASNAIFTTAPDNCYVNVASNSAAATVTTTYATLQPAQQNSADANNLAGISTSSANAPISSALPFSLNNASNMAYISTATMCPRKIQDLPEFSGEPEDWPLFHTTFLQTTAVYSYTNLENNQRLHKSLKGEAREVVKSLLIHPDNVNAVIQQLAFRFGRPEQLIQSQLRQVRDMPSVSEHNLFKLVPFATKVKNLAVFLESIDGQQHLSNPTLLDELLSKLPMSKKLEWARTAINIRPYPTILHFSDWLNEVASLICTIQDIEGKDAKRRVVLHATERSSYSLKCCICQDHHKIEVCPEFNDAVVSERWLLVKKHRLCFSCLCIGHVTRNCRKKKSCLQDGCLRKHHKLLHEIQNIHVSQNTNQPSVLSCMTQVSTNQLLFRVLPVTLYGENCSLNIYALFDDGSSITMLDKEVVDKLGVHGHKQNLDIQWFGGRSTQESSYIFNIKISGSEKRKRHLLKNVYAVSNLALPTQTLGGDEINHVFGSKKSYPIRPYENVVPQLLIGLDHAHLGLPTNRIKNISRGPYACNTELGWVVFGPTNQQLMYKPNCFFIGKKYNDDLHRMVADYFDVESIGVRSAPPVHSEEDIRAKSLLENTTRRVGTRYQTGLLWKNENIILPNSFPTALQRLKGIEKKMIRDPKFASAYKKIVKEYVDKNYARKLSPEEAALPSDRKWYLPHFGVTNPNKPSKLRLVFDAAAKVEGVSLNTHLLKGPQLYTSLPSILFNFRRGKVAVCADIREMFHQVLVDPADRVAQRFLWRNGDQDSPVEEYEMIVMTFGAACSPCSAQYVMRANATEHDKCHPRAIKAITDFHYIDDFVDSFDSPDDAILIASQVRQIHKYGGFELRGFLSNSKDVMESFGHECVNEKVMMATESSEKVLGLYWDPVNDYFKFDLKFHRVDTEVISGNRVPTKREFLSIVMSTFDPLGFLSHFTIGSKLLMREIWKRNICWDQPIPEDINNSWTKWRKQFSNIANFYVSRCYFPQGVPNDIEMHVFVDSSEDAYAATAYWRYENANGTIGVNFIAAKSKCAPLKTVTVPRLELQAAVLGTRLAEFIVESHNFSPQKKVFWSDSKTVLKWINSEHRRYKPYVAHRVSEILQSSEQKEWNWLPTQENVADEATRASANVDLSPTSRWIKGPEFLSRNEKYWPKDEDYLLEEKDEEELVPKRNMFITRKINIVEFHRFSSLLRLKRTIGWVLRFLGRFHKNVDDMGEHGLTAAELNNAELALCRITQRDAFISDIDLLRKGHQVNKESVLKNLSPYLDSDDLVRVYGRIDAASFLPYNAKRPIILPRDHAFTNLIVRHYHEQMKHQYHEATICEIRKKYWIPGLRNLMRSIVANCLVCRISKCSPKTPQMGPLPVDRVEPYVRPFTYTGLDYFGPLTVTIGRRKEKRWVALFTCLTVRAIHLEVANDLSTDSCIIAIRNFINRRGVPVRIRSDNGKNFIGASEESKRFSDVFDMERIQNEMSAKGVEWFFNCPINPSEGGIWERMVQCVKKVLRHTLKEVSPREHVLQSFLIEAENLVNSRPLTHLPISPEDNEPLTPNHFLIGVSNASETPCVEEPDKRIFSLKKQYRISRCLRDRFWKQWILEYLPTLTRRVKWCQRTEPIKEGDVVMIVDPNMSRRQWRKGIVAQVYAGSDGVIRRADVRTENGVLKRPVSKLAVLDIEVSEAARITGVDVLQNVQ